MKARSALAWIALGVAPAFAAATEEAVKEVPLPTGPRYTAVDSIPARSQWDTFRVIDRDTLIVWTSPRRPYLIELSRASPDLRNAQAIGMTSTTFRVRAKLDSVIVRGIDYPIAQIFELDHEDAWDIGRAESS